MQSLNDAARTAAAGYPGGLAALCVRMGWSYETARKELAGAHGFKLGADRLHLMSQLCMEAGGENCRAILDAFYAPHGELVRLPALDSITPRGMCTRIARMTKEMADVIAAEAAARADGVYSSNERKRVHKEVAEAIAAMLDVDQGVEVVQQTQKATTSSRKVPA